MLLSSVAVEIPIYLCLYRTLRVAGYCELVVLIFIKVSIKTSTQSSHLIKKVMELTSRRNIDRSWPIYWILLFVCWTNSRDAHATARCAVCEKCFVHGLCVQVLWRPCNLIFAFVARNLQVDLGLYQSPPACSYKSLTLPCSPVHQQAW